MANFGLSMPWLASFDAGTEKYSGGFQCGEAVNTTVTPNFNTAELYGNDQQVENASEFKNATVKLGVTRMPLQAPQVIFGHAVSAEGEEISRGEDSSPYVGYGFVTTEMENGVKKYRACVLYKVQFTEGEESYETKGGSIVFKTPNLNGVAMCRKDGEWRKKSPYFSTLEAANDWIKAQLGILESCAVPVASVKGGTFNEEQSVTLKSESADVTIKYTTDGTTPSESNGIVYDAAIVIAESTGLRAVAYKEGAVTSGVMVEEYFITA